MVDHNKIPHVIDISKGSIHDAKIMETVINDKITNTKNPYNLVADKGYIKNNSTEEKLLLFNII